MLIDIYKSAMSAKVDRQVGAREFMELAQSPTVAALIAQYRAGDTDAKRKLPAACYMGRSTNGKRAAANMVPTGLFMIDIDHVNDIQAAKEAVLNASFLSDVAPVLMHITPSGKGLRIVAPVNFVNQKRIRVYSPDAFSS